MEGRLLSFLDNDERTNVSTSLRPSLDGISSNGQRHCLGNFITPRTLVLNVLNELSVERIDSVGAVWKVQCIAIVEFVGRGIDPEISL
jgi:hypothetical protein